MGNPVEKEREFQSLLELLSEPAATAHRMIRAAQFIETLTAGDHSVDSYVIELADALPSPDTPPGYYGVDPETLRQAYCAVTWIRSRIPGLPHTGSLQEKLHSFGRNVALAYVHVGQLREACAALGADDVPSWLSVSGTAPAGTSRQRLAAAALEAKTRREEVTEQLMLLELSYPKPLRGSSLYLPALERTSDQREEAYGVLRTASLSSLKHSAGAQDDISTNILMYGTAQTREDLLERPLRAARSLASELSLSTRSSPFSGQVLFDRADALHQGSSSDLAFAALFICGLVALAEGRETADLAEDVAMTGIVDEGGNVHPVDARALATKVSTAFYSPVRCLVVPRAQLEEAERVRNALQMRYPARSLSVVGVSHLREVLYDRRVTARRTVSFPRHLGRKMWTLRRPIVLGLLLLLSGLSLRLWYGPWDKNAVHFEADGGVLQLYNESGSLVRTIDVGRETSRTLRTPRVGDVPYLYEIASLADLDGDGTNELLWANMHGKDGPISQIMCTDVSTGKERWRTPLQLTMDFPSSPDVRDDRFQPSKVCAADVDNDGVLEVYAVGCHMFFPSMVMQLDASTGKPLGHYLHTGHIRDLEFADLDQDGRLEILLTGVNNGFKEAVFAVLDSRMLAGRSPTTARYEPAGYQEAAHRAYMRFPRTAVGEVFRLKSEAGVGVDITVDPLEETVGVAIVDVNFWSEETAQHYAGTIYAWLDFSLRFKGYSSGGSYDQMYDLLVESGNIPSVDRATYLLYKLPGPLIRTVDGWRR